NGRVCPNARHSVPQPRCAPRQHLPGRPCGLGRASCYSRWTMRGVLPGRCVLAVLLGPVVGFGCGTADDGGSGGTSGTDEGSGGSATGGSATGGSATGGRGTGGDAGGQGDGGSGTGGVPTEGEVRAFPGAEGFG